MTDWTTIIRELQAEQGISQRELSRLTGVNRSTIRNALLRKNRLKIAALELIMNAFGYHLTAVSRDGRKSECHFSPLASVAERSSPLGSAAHAKRNAKKSAKPALIKIASMRTRAATTANGGKPAKPSSPSIGPA